MTEAVVRIRGRNELGRAVASAERDLKRLLKQGELIGKVFRGGALFAAFLAFERLAENAQKASEAIGDQGTARSLRILNSEIDKLKAKGLNLIGKVLGTFTTAVAGSPHAKAIADLDLRIAQIRAQLQGTSRFGRGPLDEESLKRQITLLAQMRTRLLESQPFGDRTRAPGRGTPSIFTDLVDLNAKAPKGPELFPDVVTAQRAGLTAMQAFYADAERATRTTTENIYDEWLKLDLQIAELQTDAAGEFRISAEEATKRIAENADKFLQPIEVTAHRIAEAVKEPSQLMIDAANEMRNAFAEFLMTSSSDIDEWASNFIDAIRSILAQAAATQLFSFLSTTSPALSFLAPRAMGGPVKAGGSYLVGERGPEWFVPNTSGNIVPGGGGGLVVAPVYNIDARGATTDLLRILPQVLEQNKRETVALAVQATRNRVERTGHL